MDKAKIFSCILIALNLCAAVMYAMNKDYKKAIYWVAAAVLTTTVTF